jgi:hypothetical protein
MLRTPIKRAPIKLRKSIHQDFCTCWGIKVFSIDGVPYLVIGDGVPLEQLKQYLDTIETCVGVYFSEPLCDCTQKVTKCLQYGLPVTLRTSEVVPMEILELMREVPHSAIHISIDPLILSLGSSLGNNLGKVKPLREMMFLAKSWKIFVGICVEYRPLVMKKLDLYEVINLARNQASHLSVSFPAIADDDYHLNKSKWDDVYPGSSTRLKKFYTAEVSTRSWRVNSVFRKEFLSGLTSYLKERKMTLEVFEDDTNVDRIRHLSSGICNTVTGMKAFFYEKYEGEFTEVSNIENCVCPRCKKIFLA